LPPLAPPPFKQAETAIAPFSPDEIIRLRRSLEGTRKAKAFHPVRTLPRISGVSVDLSPGASPPIVRMQPGEITTLVFIDAAGNPWPLAAAPRVSDSRTFDVEWLQDAPSLLISALSSYEDGNLVAMLRGLATPVMVKLATGEPDSPAQVRTVDYRLDLRIPGRAPGAPSPVAGPDHIALYDSVLQAFLDGLPPPEARAVKLAGGVPQHTRAWQHAGSLFLRTPLDIRSAFEQTIASSDGTHVYRLQPTPFVTLSSGGKTLVLELEIQ
jgi:intracellular multiplication protein IcmK